MTKLDWSKMLSETRRKPSSKNKKNGKSKDTRTEIERDYDRILFCTPVRRMADKTQVFPLEKNDSVRTRLTHSHEVSNLARSIGVALIYHSNVFNGLENTERNVPAMLATIGLAHDIGNPPFGHQGEASIGDWFKKNIKEVFKENNKYIIADMRLDYENFEGNAQALRILTKLQIINDQWGLNLTCGSLAALMKYPTYSSKVVENGVSKKKFGCFYSEREVCDDVWKETGLSEGVRHPFAFIMEACDDIAYSVLDAEDAAKKGLVSFYDLVEYIKHEAEGDVVSMEVVRQAQEDHEKYIRNKLSPSELNDISMQKFRVYAIGAMIFSVRESFIINSESILNKEFDKELIKESTGARLCKVLKDFSIKHAFKDRSVLELELRGHKTIHSIMDMLWPAIMKRGNPHRDKDHKGDPFERYAYNRISENYRRNFEDKKNKLPLAYKRAQLLADMVSGMTDSFAMDFEKQLRDLRLSQ